MKRKTFTPEEANRALTLVRRVTEDIVRTYGALSESAGAYKRLRAHATPEEPGAERIEDLKREMASLSDEIDAFVVELDEIGCEVKDLREGTVDFPAEMDGRRVYLCWRVGEPRVEYWHEVTEGFQGRRPLGVGVSGR
jgi:hypothetical protein